MLCFLLRQSGCCVGLYGDGEFALVMEPNGACFHHVSRFFSSAGDSPTRHVTRFCPASLRAPVKHLLAFRNSLAPKVYLCGEGMDDGLPRDALHVPVLCSSSSSQTVAWVQRKRQQIHDTSSPPIGVAAAGTSQEKAEEEVRFTCCTKSLLRRVSMMLVHEQVDAELDVWCEESDDYVIAPNSLSQWECTIKADSSRLTLTSTGDSNMFISHSFPSSSSSTKLYTASTVPPPFDARYNLTRIVARLVQFARIPAGATPMPAVPAPAPASRRLQVLHEYVDLSANTFTAFSDRSVLCTFYDRTMLKIAPHEPKIAHLLLSTGEICLATINNSTSEVDNDVAKYVQPCQRFLQTCFLAPLQRAKVETERLELDLRIRDQLNKTKQVLRMNQVAMTQVSVAAHQL